MAQRFILNKSRHLTLKPFKKTFVPKDDDKINLIRQNESDLLEKETIITSESSESKPNVTETISVEEPKKKVVVRSKKKEESNGEN